MKKYRFLNKVRVEKPCSEDWDAMTGNDQVRFCSHCAKHVNDLSAITRKEALKLVRQSGGNICIRYVADPRTKAPLFSDELIQINRRTPRVAAGVIMASMSLATFGYAQSQPVEEPAPAAERLAEKSCPDDENARTANAESVATASITGTVVDPNGAVIPGAKVVVTDDKSNELKTSSTNEEGKYKLEGLTSAELVLAIYSPGFQTFRSNLSLASGSEKTLDATLEVGEVVAGGLMVVEPREYKGELARSVSEGDVEAVRDLIAKGSDVNAKEEDKTTPLHVAVEMGNVEMVRLLIDFGAKLNARNEEKRTPLMMIDDDATRELVELLVRSGAKVNQTAEDGTTPLMAAVENAPVEVVQYLIDEGAEVNAHKDDGDTSLMLAAYADDLEKVRALLLARAEVNSKNDEDETALDRASDDEVVDLLKSFGATGKPEDPEEPSVAEDEDPPV